MGYFSRNLWRKLWEKIGPVRAKSEDNEDVLCDPFGGCDPEGRLSRLDLDDDGIVSIDDIHHALRDVLGLSVDDSERSLAKFVLSFADTDGSGDVTLQDFELFCQEMENLYEEDKWRLGIPILSA